MQSVPAHAAVTPPQVLLVAKPWRGGLAHYLFLALRRSLGREASWVHTYPATRVEWLRYRMDRHGWLARAVERLNRCPRDVTVFINLPRFWSQVEAHRGNLLWITDAPDLRGAQPDMFERIFVSDPGYAEPVRRAAGPGRFGGTVPFALDPDLHRPYRHEPVRNVCFIGNRDSKRDAHLRALLDSGLSCTIVGNYFGRSRMFLRRPRAFRPRVPLTGMGPIYARHAVALNVHARVVREGTNMRTFECAGYCIPQLVEHRPGLEALFTPGEEIATYGGADQLRPALERLLRDPAAARAMADRARRRALAEHTYDQRLGQLLAGFV